VGGRSLPQYCPHGVCVDPGDESFWVTSQVCGECISEDTEAKRMSSEALRERVVIALLPQLQWTDINTVIRWAKHAEHYIKEGQ
jgi:hypothetical protein